MRKIVAIVTAYNRADFVGRCLESILEAAGPDLEVRAIVMDNGSSDGTAGEAAARGPAVEVLRTPDNRPVIGVINRGFEAARRHADATHFVYMNEDTEYTPGSLRRLVDACDAHPDALLTPMQFNYREPAHLDDNAYEHLSRVRPLVEDALAGRPLAAVYPLPTIIGAAMIARREVWDAIGPFDTLFWFYGNDDDYCTRARHLGYRVLLAPAAHLLHAHGKLGARGGEPTPAAVLRKWRYETQARYLFILKDPAYPLRLNLARCARRALATAWGCLLSAWPRGAWHALAIYVHCVATAPAIAAARRDHFDPSRRCPAHMSD